MHANAPTAPDVVVPEAMEAPIAGLVWAFAFDAEGRAEPLPDDAVTERFVHHEGWLWLHFNLTDSRARSWIATAPLSRASRDVLLCTHARPRLSMDEGEAAGILSDFHLEYDRGTTPELGHLRFAVTERMIVSARHHPLQAVERIRDGLSAGRRLPETGLFLEAVADGFLDAATEGIDAAGTELDEIEEALITRRGGEAESRVGAIRRAMLRLHREILPLRAAMRRAAVQVPGPEGGRVPTAITAAADRLATRFDGLDHDIHALQERARLVRDEMDSIATAETNRQLYVLSVLTAAFLPGTLITGVFGMNTKDLPFQQTDGGFWFSIAAVAIATAAVLLSLRWKRIIR